MKKVLSILSLIAILGMSSPAFAAPHHGGPHGGGPKPNHHRQHVTHHNHHHRGGGVVIHTGHHPRHSHWYGYRGSYWGSPWCDYRLGWCDPYYYPAFGVHVPVGGASFSVRF